MKENGAKDVADGCGFRSIDDDEPPTAPAPDAGDPCNEACKATLKLLKRPSCYREIGFSWARN